ncbi:MAG: alcohol dehydrogenase catalytic domain-containing protein, partial [Mycobacteriales bacterium]
MSHTEQMRAYRLLDWQRADFDDVPVPEPGPGEVRVRIGGVGLCHSDVIFLDSPAGVLPYELPFTLGHEIAGWVDALGEGVTSVAVDEAVAVACMSPCGNCRWCQRGQDNYCVDTWRGRGFGTDGGLAEHVVVGAGQVVGLGDLDPRIVAPLTDAGATSYHAVKKVLPKLYDDSTAVVIGVGGLGAYGVQWLRMLTSARIIAVEARPERLMAARDLGAHEVIEAGEGLSKRLAEAVGQGGADAVLDFVGSDATIRASFRNAAKAGAIA